MATVPQGPSTSICCAKRSRSRRSSAACAGSPPSIGAPSGHARALANVLMPEFEQALRFVEDQLELHEIEENVRVHEANPEPRE